MGGVGAFGERNPPFYEGKMGRDQVTPEFWLKKGPLRELESKGIGRRKGIPAFEEWGIAFSVTEEGGKEGTQSIRIKLLCRRSPN